MGTGGAVVGTRGMVYGGVGRSMVAPRGTGPGAPCPTVSHCTATVGPYLASFGLILPLWGPIWPHLA